MSTHPVYASLDDATRAIFANGTEPPTGASDRVALALVLASRWVDRKVGRTDAADLDVPFEAPWTLDVVPRPAGQVMATLAAAVRFYGSPDVPYGVLSVGDVGLAVRSYIPEAEMHLLGQRRAFGVA